MNFVPPVLAIWLVVVSAHAVRVWWPHTWTDGVLPDLDYLNPKLSRYVIVLVNVRLRCLLIAPLTPRI